jgi:digeranylgeranylglycerophospholipid reductase
MKIQIAGGGPAGLYFGYLMSKKGFDVKIFEEHKKIGLPVSCSGLVTCEINNFGINLSDCVVNKFKSVTLNSKKNTTSFKNNELLLDRHLFDNEIKKMAESQGAKIEYQSKIMQVNNKKIFVSNKGKVNSKNYEILIGADGPLSNVAKSCNLWNNRKFYFGLQGLRIGNFEKDKYDVFFNSQFIHDFFYWSIPESNKISRIGLASKSNAKQKYDVLIKKYRLKNTIAGLIPIYSPFCKCTNEKENTYLVGDAACLLKNTTGGGIISGLESSKILAKSICNGKNYDKLLFRLHTKLIVHNIIRKSFDKFSDSNYDKMLDLLNQKRIKKIIENMNREKPFFSILAILFKEPKFAKFLTKLRI